MGVPRSHQSELTVAKGRGSEGSEGAVVDYQVISIRYQVSLPNDISHQRMRIQLQGITRIEGWREDKEGVRVESSE